MDKAPRDGQAQPADPASRFEQFLQASMPQGLQLGHSLVPRFGTVTQHVPGSAFTFSFHRPHDSLTPGHTYRSVTSQLGDAQHI